MKQTKVDIIKQSSPRTPLPRPVVFKDKIKFDRSKVKYSVKKWREECH